MAEAEAKSLVNRKDYSVLAPMLARPIEGRTTSRAAAVGRLDVDSWPGACRACSEWRESESRGAFAPPKLSLRIASSLCSGLSATLPGSSRAREVRGLAIVTEKHVTQTSKHKFVDTMFPGWRIVVHKIVIHIDSVLVEKGESVLRSNTTRHVKVK